MSLLDKIFRPDRKEEQDALNRATGYFKLLTAYQPAFTSWNGAIYESELVRAAIDARARHISKLKIEVLNSNTSLSEALRRGMNQFQTNSQFLYRASTILDCTNTCFIVPVFDESERITGYFPVLPQQCQLIDYGGALWLKYTFSGGQTAAVEYDRCAVLTKFQYRNDFFGETNAALNDTMSLIHIQNEGIRHAVKNSAAYRFMAQLTNFSKTDDLTAERKRFSAENLSNDADGGGLLLFPNTYNNIKQLECSSYTVDAEQMEQIRTNVFNYFAVNEAILQNRAYGDEWSAFYEGCVECFSIQFSEAITKAAYTTRERAIGAQIIATANRLQYLSNSDKLAVSSQMADRGIMSRNEIREIWNLPPIPGGDVPTIRGEYYLINADGTTTKHGDDITGGAEE